MYRHILLVGVRSVDWAGLDCLVRMERWAAAADVAADLAAAPNLTQIDRARALRILCECRNRLGDSAGAIDPGHGAVVLARETQQWDLLARAMYDLAAAYYFSGLYKQATDWYQECWLLLDQSESTQSLEPRIRYNLAVAQEAHGRIDQAVRTLEELLSGTTLSVPEREVNLYRHLLVYFYLRAGIPEQVPAVLSRCEDYAEAHPDDLIARYHLCNDRAFLACLRGQYNVAAKFALQTAKAEDAPPNLRAEAFLHLASTCRVLGLYREAFAVGVLAQQYAEEALRQDLRDQALSACEGILMLAPRAARAFMGDLLQVKGVS